MFNNQNFNDSNSGNKNSRKPRRFQPRVLYIYLIILGVIMALFFANPNSGLSVKNLTISEVIEKVQTGEITPWEGTMKPNLSFGREGYSISGIYRSNTDNSDLTLTEDSQEEVRFFAEGRLTEDDFLLMRDYFNERQSSTMLQDVLLSFLPFLQKRIVRRPT